LGRRQSKSGSLSRRAPDDNLFTDSVIALRAITGKLAWYFQFTPHGEHDWDSTRTPVLAHLSIGWPNRNGYYYVLDRLSRQRSP
jgi:alcohol dehydrogenase (cytochrome c)